MRLQPFMRVAATLALLCAGMPFHQAVNAQVIDFSQIDAFESMGTGTQRGTSPAKTIIDDGDRYTVFITILECNTEAKIYWKSADTAQPQTTIMRGPGVQAFKPLEIQD